MNKFYLVEISVLTDGTSPVGIFLKEDFNTALMSMYQTMASAIANNKVVSCTTLILDSTGETHKIEYFTRPQETTGDK